MARFTFTDSVLLFNEGKMQDVKKVSNIVKLENLHQSEDAAAVLEAIEKSQARIDFLIDGTITSANNNFLETMGYTLEEVVGQKHKVFCEQSYSKWRSSQSIGE